jgi:hypothetical protein
VQCVGGTWLLAAQLDQALTLTLTQAGGRGNMQRGWWSVARMRWRCTRTRRTRRTAWQISWRCASACRCPCGAWTGASIRCN